MPSQSAVFIDYYRNQNAAFLTQSIKTLRANASTTERLVDAMAYSLLNGGKRIRPLLCYAAACAVNKPDLATDTFAAALECIHAYSLIHDDLPAMDDDDLRRGRPTCHVAFDEATAILAGDALQTLAFELIAGTTGIDAKIALAGCAALAKASGARGMVLGQAIDLAAVDSQLTLEELAYMHGRKTGALIEASVTMGAISAGASDKQLSHLAAFARDMGLAFQVTDDIIDVTSDTTTLGKPQGADASRNKPTYVSLLGIEQAQEKASELLKSAMLHLAIFDEKACHLKDLARLIVTRNH